jgi:two-component system LytT family sensor kinase
VNRGLRALLAGGSSFLFLYGSAQSPRRMLWNKIYFDFIATDTRFMVRQSMLFGARDSAVWEALDFAAVRRPGYDQVVPKSSLMLGVKLNPRLTEPYEVEVKSVSKTFSSYRIPDSSDAELIALGITPENVRNYKYHVVEDDSIELVPWSPVRTMEQRFGAKRPYAFLGKFNAPGKKIMVEVVNRKDYSIRDGVIFDWAHDYRPVVTEIDVIESGNRYWNLHSDKGNHYATRFDPKTSLPLNLAFPVDSVEEWQIIFRRHETLPYVFYLIREQTPKPDTTVLSWWYLEDYYHFDSKNFDKPGCYELIIQTRGAWATWDNSQTVRIPFTVLPPLVAQRKVPVRQIVLYGSGALALIALFFGLYYLRNRRLLRKSGQTRQMASLQLKAIRSQLNPHFMFNALSSIQNLMNRSDVQRANHYLSTFAGLTRKVLLAGNAELISLEDEVAILGDYLEMEQLRFGFQYSVRVDASIDQANVEIPSMLLQPFVENAVKHGVNVLHESGRIEVSINPSGKDLLLSVKDNGSGFDPNLPAGESDGFGLKLGEERIALHNQLHKTTMASLRIDSGAAGTTIRITLASWLS